MEDKRSIGYNLTLGFKVTN